MRKRGTEGGATKGYPSPVVLSSAEVEEPCSRIFSSDINKGRAERRQLNSSGAVCVPGRVCVTDPVQALGSGPAAPPVTRHVHGESLSFPQGSGMSWPGCLRIIQNMQ